MLLRGNLADIGNGRELPPLLALTSNILGVPIRSGFYQDGCPRRPSNVNEEHFALVDLGLCLEHLNV
jgi:hypothetical protein